MVELFVCLIYFKPNGTDIQVVIYERHDRRCQEIGRIY